MARIDRVSTTAALIVCLAGSPLVATLFASDAEHSSSEGTSSQSVTNSSVPPAPLVRSPFRLVDERLAADAPIGAANAQVWRTFNFVPVESNSFAQRYRGRGARGRNASTAAMVVGAAASIAGAAVLVYANRPECSTNQTAYGCGYGAKVVGGAVLSTGIVSLVVGAVTWR
jgi:hypothetical protein